MPTTVDQLYDDLAYARRLNTELEADNARLRRECEGLRAALSTFAATSERIRKAEDRYIQAQVSDVSMKEFDTAADEIQDAWATMVICENQARALLGAAAAPGGEG